MTSNPGDWWTMVKKSAAAWIDDYAPSMGAALSYYTVFSLAPMLLIVIAVAGLIFGQEAARGALFAQLNGLMGSDAAAAVQGLLANANKPAQGILATVIGVAVLLIGATTVFGELQDDLDRVWRVPAADKSGGFWGLLRSRVLSFGMILGIGFLLIVSLVVSAVVAALGKWWAGYFGGWEILAQAVTFLFGFAVTTLGFAMIYKLMPRVDVQWRDVWIGAVVTSFLFSLGRFLISLYIGKSGVASSFGAAGSLVLVFVWVFYSAQIFLLGAEFTWVYATTYGSMRNIPNALNIEADTEIPSRSDRMDGPSISVPLVSKAAAANPVRDRTDDGTSVPVGTLIAGAAIAYALRFAIPLLLRRR